VNVVGTIFKLFSLSAKMFSYSFLVRAAPVFDFIPLATISLDMGFQIVREEIIKVTVTFQRNLLPLISSRRWR
jgi:hypothetical protein